MKTLVTHIFVSAFLLAFLGNARLFAGPIMLSGNETKIDLRSGAPKIIDTSERDSISILDFSTFPPKATHLTNIPNTVVGPPSNIAITPDGSLALIANSVKADPNDPTKYVPNDEIHLLDLKASPPRILGQVHAGKQPSGISITPDGRSALVANRADGTVTVLQIDGKKVHQTGSIKLGAPEESFSDVAISPKGNLAFVSAQKAGYLAVLQLENDQWRTNAQQISVYGQPYRVVITSDGKIVLTAGTGFGNRADHDAVSVIDAASNPMKTIDYITIGAAPESVEITPNGKVLAVVVMNGSNLAPENPAHGTKGALEILLREGNSFQKKQTLPVGAIPEGVAFTSDGKYIVVQCHPSRELWIFEMKGNSANDTGVRIKVPGMPSSLRAGP